MKKAKVRVLGRIAIVFLFIIFYGCASTPQSLKSVSINNLRKIAIVTSLSDKELKVLDHTYTWQKSYAGKAYPLTGDLIDLLINSIRANSIIYLSLGGNPDLLRREIGEEFKIKNILDENLIKRFSTKYEVVGPEYFITAQKASLKDYISSCREIGVDILLKIDFVYGLAAYADSKASAVIDADISVYDIKTSNLLMERSISSENYFKEGHVINEFKANKAELFKKNIIEAANGLSILIAYEFGIDIEEMKNKNVVDRISTFTCKSPYLLEQDCSMWNGAKRLIEINGYRLRIAGTNDGKAVLIMNDALKSPSNSNEVIKKISISLKMSLNTTILTS
jgi:hypothetical protein